MEQQTRTDIKPIRVTRHAQERMDEFRMSYKKLVHCILNSIDVKPIHSAEYKAEKYDGNEGIKYVQYGTYVFTLNDKPDRKTGKDITLVITVCDQRITLKKTPEGEGSWTH